MGRSKGSRTAVAKAPAAKKSKTTEPEPVVLDDFERQEETKHEASRRRVARRDSDAQLDRVLTEVVYKKYDKALIEALVAEDGTTPRKFIAEEINRTKNTEENLKPGFWTKFRKKIGLGVQRVEPLFPAIDDEG